MKRYSPLKRTRFERKKYDWRGSTLKRGSRIRVKRDARLSAWSKAVRERDGNQCQWPGGCQTGDLRIDAHHLAKRSQRPDLRLELSNGISLCRTHHEFTDTNKAESVALGMLNLESRELANRDLLAA